MKTQEPDEAASAAGKSPGMHSRKRLIVLLGILVVATAIFAWKHFHHRPPGTGIAVAGGRAMDTRISTPLFKQWDTAWSQQPLGKSNAPMQSTGCTVCCLAMALSSKGFPIDPGRLNGQLTAHNGLTSSGLLIWSGVKEVTNGSWRAHVEDRPTHEAIDSQLAAGNPVIAKVLYDNRVWHWVLITGKSATEYLIHDPLSPGHEFERMEDYPRGIFAIRYLEKL